MADPLARLIQPVQAISDASGNILFKFPVCPSGRVWSGTCFVDGPPTGSAFRLTVNGIPWGTWTVGAALQAQVLGAEHAEVTGTGLANLTGYTAYFIGTDNSEEDIIRGGGYMAPFPGAPGSAGATPTPPTPGGPATINIGAVGADAGTGTILVAYPGSIVAGNWLYLFTLDRGSGSNTPTGWILLGTVSNGGVAGSTLNVFVKNATGSETGNLTLTHPPHNGWGVILQCNNQAAPILPSPTTAPGSFVAPNQTTWTTPSLVLETWCCTGNNVAFTGGSNVNATTSILNFNDVGGLGQIMIRWLQVATATTFVGDTATGASSSPVAMTIALAG